MKQQWLLLVDNLRAATRTPELALSYQETRYRFLAELAGHIAGLTVSGSLNNWGPVVYGVWLHKHKTPVYIGQSMKGQRRLWDLPIGESHHLGFTFPPETWGRVVVVAWWHIMATNLLLRAQVLTDVAGALGINLDNLDEARVPETVTELDKVIGTGLEYRLQLSEKPLFNLRRKTRNGSLRDVGLKDLRSKGAGLGPSIDKIYDAVNSEWNYLKKLPSKRGMAQQGSSFGNVIFVNEILKRTYRY